MNLVLIGMPGSGKSRIGKFLAQKLNLELLDTDKIIELQYGKISEIFAEFGESYFRELEVKAVKSCAEKESAVISTGGGVILNEENVAALKKNGVIFYLKASEDTLFKRTAKSDRPLIKGDRERVKALLEFRAPLYEKYADYIIDADSEDVGEKARQIVYHFKTRS